jgi:cytochrome c oxidase subunit IV
MATFGKKEIWKVFFILTFITAIEFIIALAPFFESVRNDFKLYVNFTYIILTLAKAFYIIAFFMHLKFEKIGLIYAVALPCIFVLWAIVAILWEGNYWSDLLNN